MKLVALSDGAAQGLVGALAAQYKTDTGCDIDGTFGAVGAMRDKLLAGAPADLLILTRTLIDELSRHGHVVPGSAVDIGTVLTAVAVRRGDPAPSIGDRQSLRAALLAAGEIYVPDPKQATAGVHFASVIERLGIAADVAPRLKAFPNGVAAMRALAAATAEQPIGCSQVTEICATPGVALVAPLPDEVGLATVYTAAVSTRAALPGQARALAALLSGRQAKKVRQRAGFV